jgi:hypothetical protein
LKNKAMPLTLNEQMITSQLSFTIKDMRDFLLDAPVITNFSDIEKYKNLYTKIDELSIKTLAERYVGYEHSNPHKTLAEFLNMGETSKQILKYYSEPIFKKVHTEKNRILKAIDGTIKRAEKVAGVIRKVVK